MYNYSATPIYRGPKIDSKSMIQRMYLVSRFPLLTNVFPICFFEARQLQYDNSPLLFPSDLPLSQPQQHHWDSKGKSEDSDN